VVIEVRAFWVVTSCRFSGKTPTDLKMGAARSSDTLIGIPPHHYTASQHRRTGMFIAVMTPNLVIHCIVSMCMKMCC